MSTPPCLLTIAGSDSSGGAGIQADLKTITALGGYGMSAVTALTAQNTVAVKGIFKVPSDFIGLQIRAVAEDIGVDVVKTGMLADPATVEVVADHIEQYCMNRLVVDPVMVSKSGVYLMERGAEAALRRRLLPLATVVTPNLAEAAALAGIEVAGPDEMREAARRIAQSGPLWTVVKGGHLKGPAAVNIAFDGRDFYQFGYERIDTSDTHGTGCTFASAVATFIGFGYDVPEAVEKAGDAVHHAIRNSLRLGGGSGPVAHSGIPPHR